MTSRAPGGRLTCAVAVVAAVGWAVALSGRLAMPFALGSSPSAWAMWLAWPRGDAQHLRWWAATVAALLSLAVVVRLSRRLWPIAPTLIVAVVVATQAAPVPYPGAVAAFDLMSPKLDDVVAASSVDTSVPERHVLLLDRLSSVSDDGSVDVLTAGEVFVPQWTSLVDDAGGFWFVPAGSPEGNDMRGMMCTDPIPVADSWWACGMRSEKSPRW